MWFYLNDQHGPRGVDLQYGGAVDDDVNTISATVAEVFYRMAEAARYGENYGELVNDFGSNLHITYREWEQGQRAVRERCRAWLPDDAMWEEFLAVEIDDDGHPESNH